MYVKEKYNSIITALLTIYSQQESENIAKLLLQNRLQSNSISIIANETIAPTILVQLEKDITQLQQNKPIQYVLAEAWFYKFPFYVNEAVLIPRPETELLVEVCIAEAKKLSIPIQIIDIGTGSGCIAISIKKGLQNAAVTAVDISKEAINVAKKNAFILNADVHFIECNILQKTAWKKLPEANIIVSNPPYIPLSQKETMDSNVLQYEPHQALFVSNEDPLIFYKTLAQLCVAKNATLCCEISEYYGKETKELLEQYFSTVDIIKDFENKDRIIVGRL